MLGSSPQILRPDRTSERAYEGGSLQPNYSRGARTPSPRNRGRAILSLGGVCLDSACDWWHGLQGVFPVGDSESGSVFGLIIGDPDPVTPCRKRVVPVCTTNLSLPPPPHTALWQAR